MLWEEGTLLQSTVWQLYGPCGLALGFDISDQLFQLILREFLHPLLNRSTDLLESFHHRHSSFLLQSKNIHFNRLLQCFSEGEINFCRLGMCVEVKTSTVSNADALQPSIAGFDLCIPTIASIVSHFSRQVLTEPAVVCFDANAGQEKVRPYDEITQGLIVHHLTFDRLADGHPLGRLTRELQLRGVEQQLLRTHSLELPHLLGGGLDKPLNLSLGELSLSCQALSWRNLVPEGLSDLRNAKGETSTVLLKAVLVVQENSLGGFRSQVPLNEASRTNGSWKH